LLNYINLTIYAICTASVTPTDIPYFSYNSVNKKFSFNAPLSWKTTGGRYSFALSPNLYSLFSGLSAKYEFITVDAITNAYVYTLSVVPEPGGGNLVPNYTSLATTPLVPSSYWIKMEQNYSSINVWNPVTSIVFIARNLNVVQTLEARPYIYGFDPFKSTNNASVSNVLFEIPLRKAADPSIYFEPIPEYQLVNLLGKVETGELQIDVFWKDTYGRLNVFYLDVGSSFILKLLFRKKAFNY
jgi:hypothetical protein